MGQLTSTFRAVWFISFYLFILRPLNCRIMFKSVLLTKRDFDLHCSFFSHFAEHDHFIMCGIPVVWKEQENTRSQWLNSKCNGCICLSSAWCAPEEFVIPAFSATWLSNEAFLTLAPHLFPLQFLFYSESYSYHFNSASFQLAIPPWEKMKLLLLLYGEVLCSVQYFTQPHHITKLNLNGSKFVKKRTSWKVVMGNFFFKFCFRWIWET